MLKNVTRHEEQLREGEEAAANCGDAEKEIASEPDMFHIHDILINWNRNGSMPGLLFIYREGISVGYLTCVVALSLMKYVLLWPFIYLFCCNNFPTMYIVELQENECGVRPMHRLLKQEVELQQLVD